MTFIFESVVHKFSALLLIFRKEEKSLINLSRFAIEMIQQLKFLLIFFIEIFCEKLFMKVENESSIFIEGLIKVQNTRNSSVFVKFKLLNILKTNEICNTLGFLNIHSIQSPFQLNSSVYRYAELVTETGSNITMLVILFLIFHSCFS